ncbi:MAG: hypothetical protein HC837_04300 [Chloroflexaceae bacterium]|nr:hypothetical protein [Chloroflexaceae bacterium]
MLFLLSWLVWWFATPAVHPVALAQQPTIQQGAITLTSAPDWQRGSTSGLLITNNAGGELRLDDQQIQGSYLSVPFSTTFAINAAGAIWQADIPPDTSLLLELRGRSSPPPALGEPDEQAGTPFGWSTWRPLIAGDARSEAESGAFATPSILAFPPDTRYLQLRASFTTDIPQASPELQAVTIAFLNTLAGHPHRSAYRVRPSLPGQIR